MKTGQTEKEITKTTHTPGPWKAGTGWIEGGDHTKVCADFPGIYRDDGRAEANANLIAAAPELYRVCKMVQRDMLALPPGQQSGIIMDALADALAKAEGR